MRVFTIFQGACELGMGRGDIIATHHLIQREQAAKVSYRTRYKNQDLGGCWEYVKIKAGQKEVPFPVVPNLSHPCHLVAGTDNILRGMDTLGKKLTKPSETSTSMPSRLLDFLCSKIHLITLTGDNNFNSLKIPRRTCNREDPMPELFMPTSLRILKSADSCFWKDTLCSVIIVSLEKVK